jgi:hypothetical protein
MNHILLLVGTFIVSVVTAMGITIAVGMKGWFEISVVWAIGVTLIVGGLL